MIPAFQIEEEARERVLAEHSSLRSLMEVLVRDARDALCEDKLSPRIREGFAQLRTELERFLEYEDAIVKPILRDSDAWGPIREEQMAEEHAAQRAVLVAITEDLGEGGRDVPDVAEELAWFIASLERYLENEENGLVNEALCPWAPVVDQIDG